MSSVELIVTNLSLIYARLVLSTNIYNFIVKRAEIDKIYKAYTDLICKSALPREDYKTHILNPSSLYKHICYPDMQIFNKIISVFYSKK